jgi:2-polyprenyl-3-methyl-5-hydroxy-6-metoxy-1,4-benzoquinol methylase
MERVTEVPESFAQSPDRDQVNDYDSFAEAYSAENENNLLNAYYGRPAMLALAGDVVGHRILDAGCGSGPLSAALRDRGAVGGFNWSSPASTPAPGCWRWQGGGSVTTWPCTWST